MPSAVYFLEEGRNCPKQGEEIGGCRGREREEHAGGGVLGCLEALFALSRHHIRAV